jgi:hypothetical protein
MLPVLAAVGTGIAGPAGQALIGEAGKAIASAIDPAARAYRAQLNKDIRDVQRGNLGYTGAEKRQMLAGSQRALQAQTSAAEAGLRRAAAAQGGFGRSGAMQQAIGRIGAEQKEKLAGEMGRIDELSQAKAQQRFNDIMQRIEAKRAEARQTGVNIATGVLGGAAQAAVAYPGLKKEYQSAQADAQLKKYQLMKVRKELQDMGIVLGETE